MRTMWRYRFFASRAGIPASVTSSMDNWTGTANVPLQEKAALRLAGGRGAAAPAQADRLSDLMAQGGRIVKSVVVSDGGCLGLPAMYASINFKCGYQMGIAPDGRASS